MIGIKKMLFELQPKQMDDYEECHNYLGFTTIEILEFNYDGKGNALILEDENIGFYGHDDLNFVMFSGWYKLNKSEV